MSKVWSLVADFALTPRDFTRAQRFFQRVGKAVMAGPNFWKTLSTAEIAIFFHLTHGALGWLCKHAVPTFNPFHQMPKWDVQKMKNPPSEAMFVPLLNGTARVPTMGGDFRQQGPDGL
eukprot:g78643.t1